MGPHHWPLGLHQGQGIYQGAAIYLLEALVLLATGVEWSGSWTQKLYGTGSADVCEVFGPYDNVTNLAWRQGWRVLEPFNPAEFGRTDFSRYVNDTLQVRQPRLVVVEVPEKIWTGSRVLYQEESNAKRRRIF